MTIVSTHCRLDQQIAELEMRANLRAKRQVALKIPEGGKRSLAQVNKQNALRNMENALRNVTSRPDGSRALTADGVDPFSRRQTRPMNYWSTKRNTGALRESFFAAHKIVCQSWLLPYIWVSPNSHRSIWLKSCMDLNHAPLRKLKASTLNPCTCNNIFIRTNFG